MARYQYGVGATLETIQYLFTLGVKAPKQLFKPYSKVLTLDDGTEKGTGWAISEWYYGFLTEAEWNTLKALCSGLSSDIYVRTLDDNLAWHTYRAKIVFPSEPPDVENNSRIKVLIYFKLLEQMD